MGNAAHCCVKREHEDEPREPFQPRCPRTASWHSVPDPEETWSICDFEDCRSVDSLSFEAEQQPEARRRLTRRQKSLKPLTSVTEEPDAALSRTSTQAPSSPSGASPWAEANERHLPKLEALRAGVRRVWRERLANRASLPEGVLRVLKAAQRPRDDGEQQGGGELSLEAVPELEEWGMQMSTCLRILRALDGDLRASITMLVKAVECRIRDRELYATLTTEVTSDVRIIGRDLDRRPVVYMCAKNQYTPCAESMFQLFLTFEAAVKLTQADGQVHLVVDMRGIKVSYYMDMPAITRLTDTMGTVFAERICTVTIVDFSMIAQGLWQIGQPILTEKTKNKITFLSEPKARDLLRERLQPETFKRLTSAFDINRDKRSTVEDREAHARRTSICDVPLGAAVVGAEMERTSSATLLKQKLAAGDAPEAPPA